MKIEILSFEGCPHHLGAVEVVRGVVADLGLDVDVEEIEVEGPPDVDRLRFLGSPSVRVDGVDIDPEARARDDFAFGCRTYGGAGVPRREMVEAAVLEALERRTGRGAGLVATGGSVLSAVAASACCWIPLLAIAFGASAGGASAFFERWRPWLIGVSVLCLGLGFHAVYIRRQPGSCCDTGRCARRRKPIGLFNQAALWVATVAVLSMLFLPAWGHLLIDDAPPRTGLDTPDTPAAVASISIAIEGMTCELCAAHVESALRAVPGVVAADASYERGVAELTVDESTGPPLDRLAAAVEGAGYTMTTLPPDPENDR